MDISISSNELKKYLKDQLETFFPDKYKFEGKDIDMAFKLGLERTEFCFKHIILPSYNRNDKSFFSHLHSDQYSQFLYYISNSLWSLSENRPICDKLIYLNKMLSGMFFSYKGHLPDIFLLGHPVGTIIGNAEYSNFLVIFQNVTINTETDFLGNPAPKLGKGLFLAAGAKIIGNKQIGDRVSIGVDAMIHNLEIPDDSVVIKDSSGKILVNKRKKNICMAQQYFNVPIE